MRTDRTFASLAYAGLALVALATGANLVGCPGDLENPDRFDFDGGQGEASTPACPDVPTVIFQASCAVEGCHSAADQLGKLDLETTPLGPRLVGQPATGGPGLLIDPDNVDDSVLLTKLRKPPPFGSQMPLGSALTEEQIQCVRAWIVDQVDTAADAGPTDAGDETGETGGDETGSDAAGD